MAAFILFSLLLHLGLLAGIRLPAGNAVVDSPPPLKVYFSTPPVNEHVQIPVSHQNNKKRSTQKIPAALPDEEIGLRYESAKSSVSAPPSQQLYTPGFVEAARNIAADFGRETEQQIAAEDTKRQNSPIGMLAQYMKLPHEETRLANGILKLKTSFGTICYRPIPTFARDSATVFGVPMTCP